MTVTPSSSESSAVEQPELESTTTEQAENLLDVEQSLDAMAQDMADDIPEEVPSADDGDRTPSANNEDVGWRTSHPFSASTTITSNPVTLLTAPCSTWSPKAL
jgi:hypothetical protein